MENTKLSQLDNLVVETTKLSKKEQSITDPKELETLIKKWEDAVSGKTPIKNPKTGKPLSKGYCQDKLRLLKRKMTDLNNNITVDGKVREQNSEVKVDDKKAQETNVSVKADTTADLFKSLGESLLTDGWIKQSEGVYANDNFSEAYSAGIKISIEESKGFENFAQQLIFEATGDINLTIKVKNKATKKEYTSTITCKADQLKTCDDVREIVSKFIREKGDASTSTSANKNTGFFNAWEKLSDEEQDAFIEFYGDKLTTLLQQQD